mmetsp:Transcript_127449/g.366578  ORF Transcript_127449/g.366578 Transcript_127449/m.366578 type:complete len:316 (+) Transcript_127449:76-1023(+)|eukprot:CAMPEP_0170255010 /NCGR_PEP_ID=MMETSP0116_2-20130129/27357_1 /TAXON_ID=400756 /ORGANISM="Durinskia baltica, Strain CSIRO CS-38" /LENGTH=315 /DNA_ID=CAMNT_0010506017 /DNA_START=71 /DNA_END=1018 /DNA_ORIENTATION=-
MLTRSGKLAPSGPTSLDLECKRALQLLLKPTKYPVILPWMLRADDTAKRDVVKLLKLLDSSDTELQNQRTGYSAACEKTIVNRHGRAVTANAILVTADRLQQDLLRNRHGSHQRDLKVQASRKYFDEFADVHSTRTVDTFYRLQHVTVTEDPAARILTEHAKRRLERWQVRGPERNPQDAALIMRALRSLSNAAAALPDYHTVVRDRSPAVDRNQLLHEFSQAAPKGVKPLSATILARLQPSASAPASLPPFRPFIGTEELDAIQRPGGDASGFNDDVPLQLLKNKHRASRSKLTVAGGERDWTTSYGTMAVFYA